MVHLADRCERVHERGRAADRRERQPTTDDLPEDRDIGRDAEAPLRPAERDPEAGDDLVEHEERAVGRAARAQVLEEARPRWYQTHVGGDRLDEHRRDLVRVAIEDLVDAGGVVERHHHGVGHRAFGHTRGARQAEGGDAAAGGHQQRIQVAVVAAGELHDLRPAGCAARDPDRRHRSLGTGREKTNLLHRWHTRRDRLGQLDLGRGGRTVRGAG